jgi:hypothetical protein
VLPEFRARVACGGLEQVALDTLLARLAAEGLVRAGGRQRTDSTHVTAAVAALNRLELAGESESACDGYAQHLFQSATPCGLSSGCPPGRGNGRWRASPALAENRAVRRLHVDLGELRWGNEYLAVVP